MGTTALTEKTPASDAILDAAEAAFSEMGLHGVGMKAIALRAGVAQGLIHYHFKSKDGLYEAVVARRAIHITNRRKALLEAIDLAAADSVQQIFSAFFTPALSLDAGGTNFAGIFARLSAADERHQELVRRYYDDSAHLFVDALGRACPSASKEDCAWGYTMALGLLGIAVGGTDRAARLAGKDPTATETTQELIERLTAHATGGFIALCDMPGA